ncbi:hypothetical protein HMPREF1051_0111 [Neisseria sicca VK64]|uniref:Uncharacterized protein n=1 Tax=Neisseria sicca VK64 TaxID=1095748 RepID=I2NE64_NEISI|nr:hypothetical protein HMPREF1051_0111 [Neisseria sicca VK64]
MVQTIIPKGRLKSESVLAKPASLVLAKLASFVFRRPLFTNINIDTNITYETIFLRCR